MRFKMTNSRLNTIIILNFKIKKLCIKDDLLMSINQTGLDGKIKKMIVATKITTQEPLIALANTINWIEITGIVMPDLTETEKGFWYLGRALNLRVHLAVMVLQTLLRETDRGIEEAVKRTPLYQVFSGCCFFPNWKCPDHTKIEDFRNRLKPETHKKINDYVLQLAQQFGFADPGHLHVDSTVQEANIKYPSDASLMKHLAEKCHHSWSYLKKKRKIYLPVDINIDISRIRKIAKDYFFTGKNTAVEEKREKFSKYHKIVKQELRDFINFTGTISNRAYLALPWNIQRAIDVIRKNGWRYLLDVGHFTRTGHIKKGKLLSFHSQEVACINKGKIGKENEFGRVFQLGRIGGNFLIAFTCSTLRMEDKKSLPQMLEEHQQIFGEGTLSSIASDKGYYSKKNIKAAEKLPVENGIQCPVNAKIKTGVHQEILLELKNRRAGIEPLICHAKNFGLRKSKMKSDKATLASGYRSILGFNLHQFMRHAGGKV
jgi:transposase, IS5 family